MKEMFYKTKVLMRVELSHQIMTATAYIQEHPEKMQRAINSCSELRKAMH
jgi:predicted transcriptional regulator